MLESAAESWNGPSRQSQACGVCASPETDFLSPEIGECSPATEAGSHRGTPQKVWITDRDIERHRAPADTPVHFTLIFFFYPEELTRVRCLPATVRLRVNTCLTLFQSFPSVLMATTTMARPQRVGLIKLFQMEARPPNKPAEFRRKHKNVNRVAKRRCSGTSITFCAIRKEVRQRQRKKKGPWVGCVLYHHRIAFNESLKDAFFNWWGW